jgi:glycine dehydrogenase
VDDEAWNRPCRCTEGVFPAGSSCQDKYSSPVNRVDNAHGDRNLVCICPSPDEDREVAA